MKNGGKLFLFLLIFSVLMIVASTTVRSTSTKDKVDCLYFLVLLDKTLDYVVKGDPVGELMGKYVANAGIFGNLRDIHVSAYTAILNYYTILRATGKASFNTIAEVYRVLEGLNDVENYAIRLSACSHNAEAAKTLVVSVSTKLRNLRDVVYMLVRVAYQSQSADIYRVYPLKDTYSPGEVVEIVVPREAPIEAVEAYAWPSFLKIRDSILRGCNAMYCVYELSMPTAVDVEHLGLRGYLVERVLTVSVFARLLNGSYLGTYLATVRYELPKMQVDLPSAVKRNSVLEVKVFSEDFYNASIRLNGFEVLNTTLEPGTSVFMLDPAHHNYVLGLNTLEICINASIKTLSYCYSKAFIAAPTYPRVSASLGDLVITWSGFLTLTISNMDKVDVRAVIDTGTFKQVLTVPSGSIKQVNVFAGVLPVQGLNVNIGITALQGSYDELKTSKGVYVVNVAAIMALILASVLLPSLIGNYEKGFIVALISAWKKYSPVLARRVEPEISKLLKPYKLGLDSHIALLYYELVRKLKIRMPHIHETLREHFTEVLKSPLLFSTPKKLMWKMLLIVEKDLYSRKKPPLEEARKLYEDVLNAAREE